LSREDFLSYPIVMPQPVIAEAYERLADSLMELQAQQRTESSKLAALRDYLLPRLLSGRVRVREAECLAESVA
jgi:type I restriction enzyme S subunit